MSVRKEQRGRAGPLAEGTSADGRRYSVVWAVPAHWGKDEGTAECLTQRHEAHKAFTEGNWEKKKHLFLFFFSRRRVGLVPLSPFVSLVP